MPIVRPYVRSDGTPVRGHFRWAQGARREMTIFALFGLAVFGIGNNATLNTADNAPPRPTVTYFDYHHARSTTTNPEPHPTVSYPIKFPAPKKHRPAKPTPTVSYPIDLAALGGRR